MCYVYISVIAAVQLFVCNSLLKETFIKKIKNVVQLRLKKKTADYRYTSTFNHQPHKSRYNCVLRL